MKTHFNDNATEPIHGDSSFALYSHAVDLLRLYPHGSRQQLLALVDVYPKRSAIDLAHILSDKELAPKLEQFRQDHKSIARPAFKEYVIFIVIGLIALVGIAWGVVMSQ